ncbi:hypothetical protein FO519_008401 [Halicephalobus sp. NKZ332]|nr:hypothetical protein FO519_008401 [Halicephalobus sp. NKZ332]
MKLLFLNLILTLLFASTHAGLGDVFNSALGKLGLKNVVSDIRTGLKSGGMKIQDALEKSKGKWTELTDELFDAALREFKVDVKDDHDKTQKKGFFKKNLAKAAELTGKSKNALFGITKFSFMELEEFRKKFMMKPMSVNAIPVGHAKKAGKNRRKRASSYSVDLRKQGAVSPVRDQEDCGGCWSFATASTMETSHYQKTGKLLDLAEQQLINCDIKDHGCDGGWMGTAYTYAKSNGIPLESSNPYQARDSSCSSARGSTVKVLGYTQLSAKDTSSMMNAIDEGYSLSIALKSGTYDFMYYNGGILDDPYDCNDSTVDHAVVIVGYGTDSGIPYWIVRNTWGTGWGESGYVRIRRGINYCNMEMFPFFVDTN